jgi:hypothetical protein
LNRQLLNARSETKIKHHEGIKWENKSTEFLDTTSITKSNSDFPTFPSENTKTTGKRGENGEKTGRKRGENGEKRMEHVEKKSGDDPCADPIRGPCARDAEATGGRRSSDSAWARTDGRHVIDEYIEFT